VLDGRSAGAPKAPRPYAVCAAQVVTVSGYQFGDLDGVPPSIFVGGQLCAESRWGASDVVRPDLSRSSVTCVLGFGTGREACCRAAACRCCSRRGSPMLRARLRTLPSLRTRA
jgi:hypothetical protein